MRIGIVMMTESFHQRADELADYERAGVGVINVGELYGFGAVSRLGYLAAKTSTAALGSSILPIYSRTPALTALTAAGLDFAARGRFELGIGTSGGLPRRLPAPAVISPDIPPAAPTRPGRPAITGPASGDSRPRPWPGARATAAVRLTGRSPPAAAARAPAPRRCGRATRRGSR
jgi:Luciferase-like monooxygenase